MPHHREGRGPAVFISYATADRTEVLKFHQDLLERGIDPFLDIMDILPGDDVVMSINGALERSDFYVLVWSAAARDRYWVNSEISAAMVLEQRRARPFVFIVRLDDSELPPVLAPRRYLDAFGGRRAVAADQLAAVWTRDRAVGTKVLPAPAPVAEPASADEALLHVYARNQSLNVSHEVRIHAGATVRELVAALAEQLALPTEASEYGGAVGVRFSYRYRLGGEALAADSDSDSDAGSGSGSDVPLALAEGDVVDIEVVVEPFGPDGALADPVSFLPTRDYAIPPEMIRDLCQKAIEHLLAEDPDADQDPDED
ncbi:toll/interleukin-1 receptor domain-containing protein [Catenulispora rubra]|uniref:toll/interleukin-1 receptor domain-containing protein n=1 Tax=Catenulispora rubra TaxID=280293 RepID=UPI0018924865|nr:toll/interleukin-1 receptor domain-containing protein [Catenulispora rubra]